jgi:hypothetical protein
MSVYVTETIIWQLHLAIKGRNSIGGEEYPSKVKLTNVHPRTVYEGPEGEYKYNSTLSLTSSLVGWVVKATPHSLYPRTQTRYPFQRRLGGPQDRSGQMRKISPPPGLDSWTVQAVGRND